MAPTQNLMRKLVSNPLSKFTDDDLRKELLRRTAARRQEDALRKDFVRTKFREGEDFVKYYSRKRRERSNVTLLRIVEMSNGGKAIKDIAAAFGLSTSHIRQSIDRRQWRNRDLWMSEARNWLKRHGDEQAHNSEKCAACKEDGIAGMNGM